MFRKTQSHNGTAGFVSNKASGISSNHTPTAGVQGRLQRRSKYGAKRPKK